MHGPIGVFDSGVGGLTVVRQLRATLPQREIIYLGDTARVPYGSKSARTVERYALACQEFLLGHQVSLVMIACNTASATALEALGHVSPVPVIGAVQPGAAEAVKNSVGQRIGVIGTLATIQSGAYEREIRALSPNAVVSALACPMLVPLAEEGWTDDDIATAVASRYIQQLLALDPDIDTLVLGCTHYPLLRAVIASVAGELTGRSIAIVDSANAMAVAARNALATAQSAASTSVPELAPLRCFVTDASRLEELAQRFLGGPLDTFEVVDL